MKIRSSSYKKNADIDRIDRRQFLKNACLYTAGALGTIGSLTAGQQPMVSGNPVPGKMTYRRLGRSGLKVSAVVAAEMDHPQMHERAYELGVNYWHKVGNFEHPGPDFFKTKERDSFACDMVIDTLDKDGAIAQFEWGLKQSGLEMIDFLKLHSLYGEPDDIKKYDGIFKAFEYLKKKKKTRFLAIAQHSRTAEVLTACIESALFDAIQPNFNVFSPPEMFELMRLAEKHDVGVICKKVLAGGERNWQRNPNSKQRVEERLQETQLTLGQAMLKWALNVPGVTAVVPLITNFQHLEEDIAVGFEEKTLSGDKSVAMNGALMSLKEELSSDYCRACGRCESVCPGKISIPDIFRFQLYLVGYGKTQLARQLYQSISKERTADNCIMCGTCEDVCPHHLPIREKLINAHQILSV